MYEENEREDNRGKLVNQEVQRLNEKMKAAMKAVDTTLWRGRGTY